MTFEELFTAAEDTVAEARKIMEDSASALEAAATRLSEMVAASDISDARKAIVFKAYLDGITALQKEIVES